MTNKEMRGKLHSICHMLEDIEEAAERDELNLSTEDQEWMMQVREEFLELIDNELRTYILSRSNCF